MVTLSDVKHFKCAQKSLWKEPHPLDSWCFDFSYNLVLSFNLLFVSSRHCSRYLAIYLKVNLKTFFSLKVVRHLQRTIWNIWTKYNNTELRSSIYRKSNYFLNIALVSTGKSDTRDEIKQTVWCCLYQKYISKTKGFNKIENIL